MNWRKRLFSNMLWRTVLASFGERSGYSKEPGGFVPYFQYRIGPYNSDLYLYFPKEPFPLLYKNEIFNKLEEYTGYDIIKHLQFHYAAYSDSQDFLRFLHFGPFLQKIHFADAQPIKNAQSHKSICSLR